jgi:hypothetical protein
MKDALGHGSNGRMSADARETTRNKISSLRKSIAYGDASGQLRAELNYHQSKLNADDAAGGGPSNAQAAQSLMSGLKSTMVPVHDSMTSGTTDRAGIRDKVYSMLKGMGPSGIDTSKY